MHAANCRTQKKQQLHLNLNRYIDPIREVEAQVQKATASPTTSSALLPWERDNTGKRLQVPESETLRKLEEDIMELATQPCRTTEDVCQFQT